MIKNRDLGGALGLKKTSYRNGIQGNNIVSVQGNRISEGI